MRWASLLLLAAFGCDDPPPGGALRGAPVDEGLWVLTYNVNFEQRSDATVDAIAGADADLVFLQETHAEWEASLRERLASRYPVMIFRHDEAEGGMAVLSRHPITERRHERSPDGAFPSWCVTASTPLGDLDVLHVHLRPPLDEDGSLFFGYFTTRQARADELRHHLGCFTDAPDVVAGDFNEGEGASVDALSALGLREAQRAHPPLERTWTWQTSAGEMLGRPDHVFVGPALRVAAVQVIEQGGSDHRPLRVQLAGAAP